MKNQDLDKSRSYIQFGLGHEDFAIIVNRVVKILHSEQLTQVPNSSPFVEGILNFRGSIVPVINLHKRFNFVDRNTENKMVIVIELVCEGNSVCMGLLVDEVSEVIERELKDLRTVPDKIVQFNPDFLEGFIESQGRFIMILNVDRVMNVSELAEI
jgi:purine-binding chemotaxis protein CheW